MLVDKTDKTSFCIVGAGSWGTALAILLARNGHDVLLWGHQPDHVEELHDKRENTRYLPDIPFPDKLQISGNLADAVTQTGNCLIAVPSHAFRDAIRQIRPSLQSKPLIWASKGMEPDSGKLLHEVVTEEFSASHVMSVISGPTFAREVAAGLPTALTVASNNNDYAEKLAGWLHGETFRAYTSDDITGVEVGGAVKNVLAIAAGIADGLGFGANTRAALITRGLHEIMMLGLALGGKKETFMGLAGLGDLVLTCTDNQSRNRRFGLALAGGKSRQEALQEIHQTIEGIQTTLEVLSIAARLGVEMPITQQVGEVLSGKVTPQQAVHTLLGRELKAESL